MFGTRIVGLPFDVARTYLAIRIGEVRFSSIETCILVIALATALLSAFKLWRIGHLEEREKRLHDALRSTLLHRTEPARTRRQPWYQRLGVAIAAAKIIGKAKQESLLAALSAAGIKGHDRLAGLIAGKVCGGAAFVALVWLLLEWQLFLVEAATLRLAALVCAFLLGWRCAEAGLSLDQAIEQVGHDLLSSNPDIAEELAATAAEMRVLPDRAQALENLALRTGISNFRSIIATLNQSLKFGTPLAESLRILAAEMRAERLARFEERAARLPVLLSIPLMAFVLPSLMIVIGTPLVLRILDTLGTVLGRGP